MLNKNSLGLLKKGAAKQSKIKRADTRASLHTNLFKLPFGRFLSFKFHAKKWPNDNLKRFVCKLALVSVLV